MLSNIKCMRCAKGPSVKITLNMLKPKRRKMLFYLLAIF